MRVLFDAKLDLTYYIFGIRSTKLNMVGNKNNSPPPHKIAFNTLLEQVVSGVSVDWRTIYKSRSKRRRVKPTSRENIVQENSRCS